MRKQKSIRWFRYTVEDAKAAQAELDEQAERGWELEEVGLFTATFRRAERPRRCWVEPARWKSERKKDWDARSDYLTLCGEAGWELLEEDGGLFYFRAKEGTDPAPLQTDEDVEWADVWKKALADQVFVTRQAVSRWESGETVPGPDTLKLLSRLFNVSINTLLGSPEKLICQCCGMPLEDSILSREPDGTPNQDYCQWCYADGEFAYTDLNTLIDFCAGHMASPAWPEDQVRAYLQATLPTLKHWKHPQ